jgi:hypothetical protein
MACRVGGGPVNLLVVYYARYQYPLRTAIADHLYAFQRYAPHNCYYLNLAVRKVPFYLFRVNFDLIVFHTIFLWQRVYPEHFRRLLRKAWWLRDLTGTKIALPQDEHRQTDALCDFINSFGIHHVFSVAPESEWSKIYSKIDFKRVKLSKVLTGYLDAATLTRINRLAATIQERPIDIGYRATPEPPWTGRHGLLKTQIAEVFQQKASGHGLVTDISIQPKDAFLGDRWYEFLLRCKYTLGVESGASVLHRDENLIRKTTDYLTSHPQAKFEEVEAACFPGYDGSLQLAAVGPRHLEACATRTCQILTEGTYSGILIPGKHYIELKRDFSNINEVLRLIKQDHLRESLTNRAYQDVVASGRYTYRGLVQMLLVEALGERAWGTTATRAGNRVFWTWARWADRASWLLVALSCRVLLPLGATVRRILRCFLSEEKVRSVELRLRRLITR